MLVSDAIQQVRDDLLESSSAGPFTNSLIVNALTEGLRHLYNVIVLLDNDGTWLGAEADYTYPANTRWVNLTAWSGLNTKAPNKIITLQDRTGSYPYPMLIDFLPNRSAQRNTATGARGNVYAVLKGAQIGLRQIGTDTPPTVAIPTRMIFIPACLPITTADTAKTIGTDFPFPADFVESIVAYAVVRLQMAGEVPSSDQQRRFAQIENDLKSMVSFGRKQTSNPPEVQLSNPWLCY